MRINDIIIKPHLTEKAISKTKQTVYPFEVAVLANKDQIRYAVEQLFNVKVNSVKTTTKKGKTKRVGKKMIKKELPNRKIAYVTVKQGTIDVFPQT